MPRVFLHNLTHQYNSYNPDLFYFDENAIFFAEPGDIVVSRRKISEEYLVFLRQIGCLSSNITFIVPPKKQDNTPTSIFQDDNLIRDIKRKVTESKKEKWILDSFALTDYEAAWAQKIGIVCEGDHNYYHSLGSKSNFRSFAKEHQFLVPKGFEYRKDNVDIALAATTLFLKGSFEIVVKEDEGAAGLGSRRFTKSTFLSDPRGFLSLFSTGNLQRKIIPVRSGDFVVEEWIQNIDTSPSIQLYIDSQGLVKVVSLHNQLFYNNKMTYRGCVSLQWLPELVKETLVETGVRFAKILSKKGYRGHLSFNTIVAKDGTHLFTEINPRRVMSSYPFQIVQRLIPEHINQRWYISFRIQKNIWRGKDIAYILKQFSSYLFSPKYKKGIIPYNYGFLYSKGHLSFLCIGASAKEANNFLSYAISL